MTQQSEQDIRRSELARKTEDLSRMKLKNINLEDKNKIQEDQVKMIF